MSTISSVDLTTDQTRCLWQVVCHLDPLPNQVQYAILGLVDLMDRERALAMVQALRSEDWAAVSAFCDLAGANNLLAAILLRFGARQESYAYAALRFPFEPMEEATLEHFGRLSRPERLLSGVRWSTLPDEEGRKVRF